MRYFSDAINKQNTSKTPTFVKPGFDFWEAQLAPRRPNRGWKREPDAIRKKNAKNIESLESEKSNAKWGFHVHFVYLDWEGWVLPS